MRSPATLHPLRLQMSLLVLLLFIDVSRGFIGNSGVRRTRVDFLRPTLSLKSSSSSVEDLRSLIYEAGQIGISVDPDLVSKITTVVDGLPQTVNPTEIKLTGTHELLFSMAKGGEIFVVRSRKRRSEAQ